MTSQTESIMDECVKLLQDLSVEDLISLLPKGRARAIGQFLHTKGYEEAMKYCTKQLGDVKI